MEKTGSRGTDMGPAGQAEGWATFKARRGGEGEENGVPHYSDMARHPHPPLFPLPNPPRSPSLCKSSDYTDLHNSCIISICSCQAFRLYKVILLSLIESKSQWERFSVLFSLNTKTISKS